MFNAAKRWSGAVIKLLSGKFAVTGNREFEVYDTLEEAQAHLLERSGSVVTELLGGKIYELLSREFLAVSDYESQPARFDSFVEAGQWLLERMNSATTKVLGGEVRKLSIGKFVAVSRHLVEPTFHCTFDAAAKWLARQEELALRDRILSGGV